MPNWLALTDERLQAFSRLCNSIAVLGEVTKHGMDLVSGLGERLPHRCWRGAALRRACPPRRWMRQT